MTPEELLAQLSQPGLGEAYLATQGAGTGMFNFGGPLGTLLAAQQLYKGYSGRKTAERQKEENLRLLALDAMAEQGIDPFAIYDIGKVESTIDPVEQAELDLAQQEMDIITPPQPVAEGYAAEQEIKRFREENPDIIAEVYSDFLRSGLDYDEYRKQFPIEEEIVDVNASTIDDTTTTLEEDTLADIIGRWIGKQTGPVTQERILEKIGELGYTGEDFNAAVEGSNIPSLENFVTEEDLSGSDKNNGGNGGTDGGTGGGTDGGDGGNGGAVDQSTPTPTPTPDLNEPVKQETILPQLPLTQEVTQEPESTTGMLFAALSPTRTTSEVLAPDLFKLDKNIPLVGRLTQSTPMAAPQYLLSGISQRYRV
jgi:hypothetical protein